MVCRQTGIKKVGRVLGDVKRIAWVKRVVGYF